MPNKKKQVTVTSKHSIIANALYKSHRGVSESVFGADVEIVCKGGYIPAHSFILGGLSPVLKQHFDQETRAERERTVIQMPDYAIDDVTPVLHCFYTGQCCFSKDQIASVYEIFEQLGVRSSDLVFRETKAEDKNKKPFIRRYLDMDPEDDDDDDDDDLIEDGETITIDQIPPEIRAKMLPGEGGQKSRVENMKGNNPGVSTYNKSANSEQEPAPFKRKEPTHKLVKVPVAIRPAHATKVLRDGATGVKNPENENNSSCSDEESAASESNASENEEGSCPVKPRKRRISQSDGNSDSVDEVGSKGKEPSNRSNSGEQSFDRSKRAPSPPRSRKRTRSVKTDSSSSTQGSERPKESSYNNGRKKKPHSSFSRDCSSSDQGDEYSPSKKTVNGKRQESRASSTSARKLRPRGIARKSKIISDDSEEEMRRATSLVHNLRRRKKIKYDENEDEEEELEKQKSSSESECDNSATGSESGPTSGRSSSSASGAVPVPRNDKRETKGCIIVGVASPETDDCNVDGNVPDVPSTTPVKSADNSLSVQPKISSTKGIRRPGPGSVRQKEQEIGPKITTNEVAKVTASSSSRDSATIEIEKPKTPTQKAVVDLVESPPKELQSELLPSSRSCSGLGAEKLIVVTATQAEEALKTFGVTLSPTKVAKEKWAVDVQALKRWRAETKQCQVCNNKYPEHSRATKCLRDHKCIRCWICLEVVKHSEGLVAHQNQKHSDPTRREAHPKCPICQQSVPWRVVQSHITNEHFAGWKNIFEAQNANRRETENNKAAVSEEKPKSPEINSDSDDVRHRPLATVKPRASLIESDDNEDKELESSGPPTLLPNAPHASPPQKLAPAARSIPKDLPCLYSQLPQADSERATSHQSSTARLTSSKPQSRTQTQSPVVVDEDQNSADSYNKKDDSSNVLALGTMGGASKEPLQAISSADSSLTNTNSSSSARAKSLSSSTASAREGLAERMRIFLSSKGLRPFDQTEAVGTTRDSVQRKNANIEKMTQPNTGSPANSNIQTPSMLHNSVISQEDSGRNTGSGSSSNGPGNVNIAVAEQVRNPSTSTCSSIPLSSLRPGYPVVTPSSTSQLSQSGMEPGSNQMPVMSNNVVSANYPGEALLVSNHTTAPSSFTTLLSSSNALEAPNHPASSAPISNPDSAVVVFRTPKTSTTSPSSFKVPRPPTSTQLSPPYSSDTGSVYPGTGSPGLSNSRDLTASHNMAERNSQFLSKRTIEGVPFRVYVKPRSSEPRPDSILSVAQDRVFMNRLAIRSLYNPTGPQHSYLRPQPNVFTSNALANIQRFQMALDEAEGKEVSSFHREINASSPSSSTQTMQLDIRQPSNITYTTDRGSKSSLAAYHCKECNQNFSEQRNFIDHMCFGEEED